MARLISPPRSELDRLPTPLTNGERRVLDLLDQKLPEEWEFYVQPHLNGLRPDLVILHPRIGVAVFEVKDWDLSALDYFVGTSAATGEACLMARDRSGRMFRKEDQNPVSQIRLYKSELFELYCPRLNNRAGLAAISGGLIFTRADRADVERLLAPIRAQVEAICKYPNYHPLAGADDLRSGNMDAIFPEWRRERSSVMLDETAEDLRAWLKEPAFSIEQRLPLELDARQRELASSRTETGYRRIKGPAGSGKSVVLAARAAELASVEKHVLVVTYNITLLNYLRDLAARHATDRRVVQRQIDFLNFHMWCKRVCLCCGCRDAYNRLWAASSDGGGLQPDRVLQEGLSNLVRGLYRRELTGLPRYDAILVDEGQDYRPGWWQTLRNAVKPGGEMVLVADKTQNIYSTASAWTEEIMANAGFRGPWTELRISYRLPPTIIPLVTRFAEDYLRGEEIDVPQVEDGSSQMELADLFPVELRWVDVSPQADVVTLCVEEVCWMMQQLRPDTAIPDITFLSGKNLGKVFVEEFEQKNVHVLHTFDLDKSKARRQKRAFFQGSAKVKATTLHSFKGWEARHLVVFVGSVERAEDRALLYTALTRLRRHENGSALTVVSSCPELRAFGESWPAAVPRSTQIPRTCAEGHQDDSPVSDGKSDR
jgi:hypothetical protein